MFSCKEYLSPKAFRTAFLLTYDRVRKYEDAWHLERIPLFPSYIILECVNEEILLKEFRESGKIAGFGNHLVRMNPEEEEFLKALYGGGHHLKMSRGIIFKGATRITEGPLKGMENRICKIDRHKRLARIRTVFSQADCWEDPIGTKKYKFCYISAGLEITEKVE